MEVGRRQRRGRWDRKIQRGKEKERRSGVDAEGLVKLLLGPRHSGENIESVAMNILVTSSLSREDNKSCETR